MEQLTDISLSAVVLGLGSIVGQLGLPKKLIPLCNLVIGIVLAFLMIQGDLAMKLLQGVILGLTASGLYSGTKNVTEHIKNKKR